ncbi:helix-turn-helix domain-containing protein [Frankia sp. Cj3]|uniref:helix-turn-helix domain-containing protein n=1 Tax=Frankia sp. Cj3 TaxID=2880976 RepID=UPI001EF3FB20|nr:helix-turn-helix domain-containing protein [Frankia sp. Cj3]
MDQLSIAEIQALPATVTLMTAARAIGISRTVAYELARRGAFPCPVQRIGRRYRVQTTGLLAFVGIESDGTTPTATPPDSDSRRTPASAEPRRHSSQPTAAGIRADRPRG